MTEQKLKEYFENILTAEELVLDLNGSRDQTSAQTTSIYIDTIEEGEFEITKAHLLKLCNDTLNEYLLPVDLNAIAFAIITSDFFHWNKDSKDTEIIEEVLYDWDNPEIGYDLSIKNVGLWKEYLETGNYNFDEQELKNKFQ